MIVLSPQPTLLCQQVYHGGDTFQVSMLQVFAGLIVGVDRPPLLCIPLVYDGLGVLRSQGVSTDVIYREYSVSGFLEI